MTKKATKEPKDTPAPPTAADGLAKAKRALEDRILALCVKFEADTGLLVCGLAHPRQDNRDDILSQRELKKDERVDAFVMPPFVQFRRR